MGHKRKQISDTQYRRGYTALLRQRGEAVRAWYESLQTSEDITLLCFCPEGKFCHRHIIAEMLRARRPDLEIVEH